MPHIQRRLAQLGVQTWHIARPQTFKGEVAITILPNIKLVIVAEQSLNLHDRFINDLLHSQNITHAEVIVLRFEQLSLLSASIKKDNELNIWLFSDWLTQYNHNSDQIHIVKAAQALDPAESTQSAEQLAYGKIDIEQDDEVRQKWLSDFGTLTEIHAKPLIVCSSIEVLKQDATAKKTFWAAQ